MLLTSAKSIHTPQTLPVPRLCLLRQIAGVRARILPLSRRLCGHSGGSIHPLIGCNSLPTPPLPLHLQITSIQVKLTPIHPHLSSIHNRLRPTYLAARQTQVHLVKWRSFHAAAAAAPLMVWYTYGMRTTPQAARFVTVCFSCVSVFLSALKVTDMDSDTMTDWA